MYFYEEGEGAKRCSHLLLETFRSKRFAQEMQASTHYVPSSIYVYPNDKLGYEDEEIHDIRLCGALNSWIQDQQVKRGDIVVLQDEDGYRNDYRFVFDGTQLCFLDYEAPNGYDYGIIPKEFPCIREFPVGYWDDALKAATFCWIPFGEQEKRDFFKNLKEWTHGFESTFSIDSSEVTVYVSFDEDPDDHMESLVDYIETCVNEDKLLINSQDVIRDLPEGPNIAHIAI